MSAPSERTGWTTASSSAAPRLTVITWSDTSIRWGAAFRTTRSSGQDDLVRIIACSVRIDTYLMNYLLFNMILLFVFSCVCLHADRRPDERSANLAKFKAKQVSHVILCKKILSREFAFLFIEVTCLSTIYECTNTDTIMN